MTTEAPGRVETAALVASTKPDTFALALMTNDEFQRRLEALKQGRARVSQIQREIMTEDVDYGTIPGTPKPTLYKSGAETLCVFHGLVARMEVRFTQGDGTTTPDLTYDADCFLHLGSTDGPIVGTGHGTANSWERRYRYRRGERTCPSCQMVGTVIKGKAEYGGGWLCWRKKGGCGAEWSDGEPAIEGQHVGDIENPDPWDLAVTLMKMAEKRAHVDATLRATGTSGLFTQDVEDGAPDTDAAATAPVTPPDAPGGCEHRSTVWKGQRVVCKDCGLVLATKAEGEVWEGSIGQLKDAIHGAAAARGWGRDVLEQIADEVGVPKGTRANADQLRQILARIESPAPAGEDGTVSDPVSSEVQSEAGDSPFTEPPTVTAEEVAEATGGEVIPPHPKSEEYKALPSVGANSKAAARAYWAEQERAPKRPDAEQIKAGLKS